MIHPDVYPGLKAFKLPDKFKSFTRLKVEETYELVLNTFEINMNMLLSKNRQTEVADARRLMFYVLVKRFKRTYKAAGEELGNRDHTTVIHAVKTFPGLYNSDEYYRGKCDIILQRIGLKID